MRFKIFVHLTWTTMDRRPLIDAKVAEFLKRALPSIAGRHNAQVLQLGMVNDHVHMILALPQQVDVSRLVQGLKGASARIANRDGVAGTKPLRWAQGYNLESVGPRGLESAMKYVGARLSDILAGQYQMWPWAEAPARRCAVRS